MSKISDNIVPQTCKQQLATVSTAHCISPIFRDEHYRNSKKIIGNHYTPERISKH